MALCQGKSNIAETNNITTKQLSNVKKQFRITCSEFEKTKGLMADLQVQQEDIVRGLEAVNSSQRNDKQQNLTIIKCMRKENDILKEQLIAINHQINASSRTIEVLMTEQTRGTPTQVMPDDEFETTEKGTDDKASERQRLQDHEDQQHDEDMTSQTGDMTSQTGNSQCELCTCTSTEVTAILEKYSKRLEEAEDTLKKEKEKAQNSIERWNKANSEVAKLTDELKNVWEMYYNANHQNALQMDMLKNLKQDKKGLHQHCLFIQFKLKDVAQSLSQKTQEMSELTSEIANYKIKLGFDNIASYGDVDERIQHLLKTELDLKPIEATEAKLQAAEIEIVKLQERLAEFVREKQNLEVELKTAYTGAHWVGRRSMDSDHSLTETDTDMQLDTQLVIWLGMLWW